MKRVTVAICLAAMLFVACGDDSSSSPGPDSDNLLAESSSSAERGESSSSVIPGRDPESSSEKAKSSSDTRSEAEQSSSSEKTGMSSSSVDGLSLSSAVLAVPCKTETEDNCEYGSLTDERDGKTYKTVKIYNKWWMAENLDYADSVKTPSLKGKSWCYADDPENCAKYGRLYTWAAAIDSVKLATVAENPQDCGDGKGCKNILPDVVQGICPDGWHLPDYDEASKLLPHVGGYDIAGTVLKSQSGWNENGDGKDVYGFNVLPAGIRLGNGSFDGVGEGTDFWSATEQDPETAHTLYFYYEYEYAGVNFYEKGDAFSIRCVMD